MICTRILFYTLTFLFTFKDVSNLRCEGLFLEVEDTPLLTPRPLLLAPTQSGVASPPHCCPPPPSPSAKYDKIF